MNRLVPLMVAAALAGCTCSNKPGAAADGGALEALGALVTMTGQVELERAGQRSKAKPGPLYGGDGLTTEAESSATLQLGEDRELTLSALSHLILGTDGTVITLDLQSGLAVTRVSGKGGISLAIETPLGITRVADGEVRLTVGADNTTVEVLVGEAEQILRSGERLTLPAGSKRSSGARVLEPVELMLVMSGGVVELKPAGQKNFSRLRAKEPLKVAQGDTVRVRDGQVTLRPNDSKTAINVKGGGEVVIGEAQRGETGEETHFTLSSGPLQVTAPKGQTTKIDLGEVDLESTTGGQITVTRTKHGLNANAHTGSWTLKRPDDPQSYSLTGGGTANIDKGGVRLSQGDKEPLTLPSKQGLTLHHTGIDAAAITWDCAGHEAFDVQVAHNSSFESPFLSGLVSQCFINVPLPKKGALHWRVTADGAPHAQGSVNVGPEPKGGKELSRLNNDVVDGPEVTSIFFQDKPPVVTFRCLEVDKAASYRLRVFHQGELTKPAAERTSPTVNMSVPEGVLMEGHYLWACDALDGKGAELGGGRLNKLDMVYDNAVASLLIKSPRPGERASGSVRVAGVAPVGSKLFVDGRPMNLDDAARFEDEVRVPASGLLIFRLLHRGSERFIVRSVRGR